MSTVKYSILITVLVAFVLLMSACNTTSTAVSGQPNINLPARDANPDVGSTVFNQDLSSSLTTAALEGINLLANAGFEGNLDGWTACGDPAKFKLSADAHQGSFAGEVNGDCFYQSFEVTGGDNLALSCYAKHIGEGWAGMGMGFSDGNWQKLSDSPDVTIISDQYLISNTAAVAPDGSKYATVWVYADGQAFLDSCSVVASDEAAPTAPVSNLIQNAGFEHDLAGWNNCGSGQNYSIITSDVTEGAKALKVSGNGCAYQDLSIEAGQTYTLTCQATGGAKWGSVTLSYLDSSWTSIAEEVVAINSNSFESYTTTLAAPADAKYAAITFYAEDATVYDDCKLELQGVSEPTEPTEPTQPTTPPVVNNNQCVGDRVWSDLNNNGLQDAGEPGIAGVGLELYLEAGTANGIVDGSDAVVGTKTTDENGNYKFCGLEVYPEFYIVTLADTANVLADFTASNTPTTSVAVGADQTVDTVDFGFYKEGAFTPMPAIDIRKNEEGADSQSIDYDGVVNFAVVVKNTGNVALTDVQISDPDKTDCARTFTTLAVGAEESYTCKKVNVTEGFTNTITVNAMHEAQNVTDQDISQVVVGEAPQPAIDIRKQEEGPDSRTFDYGSIVSWSIVVTNTGNVALTDVVVTDPTKSTCNRTIGAMAVGASETYSCIVNNVTADLTNSATVIGKYNTQEVNDEDSSSIVVRPQPAPAIDIRKQEEGPDTRQVESGEVVIYDVAVTNTGNVDLTDVVVNDPDKTDCYNLIGDLAAGATVSYTCTLRNATQNLTNNITVTGSYAGQTVSDSDESSITIIVRNGSIGNSIWWDDNKNGLIDGDEVGISGVTVRLHNAAGATVKETTTNQSGTYLFNDVTPGQYRIAVILPSGTRVTTKDAGDDNRDSDLGTDGKSDLITLGNGENIDNIDGGLVYTVYEQADNNLLNNFYGRYDYVALGASENYREDRYDCRDRGDQSVNLNMPAGAQVAGAYLYWSGSGQNDSTVSLNGSSVSADTSYNYYVNNGPYSGNFFGNIADVTARVSGNGSYKVSNLSWSNADQQFCFPNTAYGVWTLVVVYEQANLPISGINVYKAFEQVWPEGTWGFDIDKLSDASCNRSAQITHISYEGDSYKGEDLVINGQNIGNNTYNGSTGPNLDVDTYTVNVAPGQDSVRFETTSYRTDTSFGLAIEFAINGGFVAKTNACSTLKPNDGGVSSQPTTPIPNIVEIALADPQFSTLVAAVSQEDLVDALSGTGPLTVFAPTNAAFEALASSLNLQVSDLLALPNLKDILFFHVAGQRLTGADIIAAGSVSTLQGSAFDAKVINDKLVLNDNVTVVAADIAASNGIIHVIDNVLLPATPAPTPNPTPQPDATYSLATGTSSNMCLDVEGGSSENGANIKQWHCNGTGAQTFEEVSVEGGFMLRNIKSGKCVTVSGADLNSGANVKQWTCDGSANQILSWSGSSLIFKHSGKCLDVDDASSSAGANIKQYGCNGTIAQKFSRK